MTLPTDPVVIVNEYKTTRKTQFVAPSRPTANDPTYENSVGDTWRESRATCYEPTRSAFSRTNTDQGPRPPPAEAYARHDARFSPF